jgi:formylglycine-generating enzyme required for sulfatase activity
MELKNCMKNLTSGFLLIILAIIGSDSLAQADSALLFSTIEKGSAATVTMAIASEININARNKNSISAPPITVLSSEKLNAARALLLAEATGSTSSKPMAGARKVVDINKVVATKSEQAIQEFKAGNYAKAIPLFREAVVLSPRDAFDWHFLGRSLDKTGDLSDAKKAYQTSLSIAPKGKLAQRNRLFLSKLRHQGKVFTDCLGCPKMVIIPAGSFDMGSNSGYDDEIPVHRVTISQAFAIGKTEVTQGQWKSIMGNNPSTNSSCGDNCPVEQVSWRDVQAFIQKLNDKTGKQYRLPTEAEWEYACRAGAQQTFCGSNGANSVAWFEANSSHPVAEKQANTWGLYDMSGNVWEWIADPYHDSYNGAPDDGSMWNGDAALHVVRGGSWYSAARYGRAAIRGRYAPDARYNDGGFRLARSLP